MYFFCHASYMYLHTRVRHQRKLLCVVCANDSCSLMYFILFLWRLTWSVWNSGFFVINENFRLLWEYKLHGLNGLTSNFKVVVVTRSNIPEMEALVVGSVYRTYRKYWQPSYLYSQTNNQRQIHWQYLNAFLGVSKVN